MRLNCETSGEKRQKHGPGQRFRGRRPPPGGGVQPARRRARPGTASPHPRWASANPGAELGRRRGPRSGPASSPAPLPPAVPAAPEPREPAAAAQVPEAALTPQVGAARRRRGRAQLQRGRVPAALAFRPPPDGPRQPAVPRPTGTQPWQRRRRRAPAPCGLAGPASLAAFGGFQCMPSARIPAESTPSTSARTFAGAGGSGLQSRAGARPKLGTSSAAVSI